jgi:hypothetical protein
MCKKHLYKIYILFFYFKMASSSSSSRDIGLDTLKAFGIISVLFWHLQPIQIYGEDILSIIIRMLVITINYQLFLVAVPIFFVVSIYLFLKKANSDNRYSFKRLLNLFKLFAFWTGFHLIFYFITQVAIFKTIEFENLISSLDITKVLLGIQPSLPLAGDSVFYFLFNLIFLTALAFMYKQVAQRNRQILSIAIIIIFTIYFEFLSIIGIYINYYRLDNFIVYIAIADIFATTPKLLSRLKYLYLAIYICFSVQDIIFREMGMIMSIYARGSILYASLVILSFIYPLNVGENLFIKKLAKYSLGIYAFHKYWQYLIIMFIIQIQSQISFIRYNTFIPLLVTFLVIITTAATIFILNKTPLKVFIC